MKKMWMLVLWLVVVLFPIPSQAFLCNGKDFGCFASWIMPFNQTEGDSKDYHEWAASNGHVIGKDGNVIEFKVRFDGQSLETLQYNFKWYSKASALLQIRKFGLEIDICDPNNVLEFDNVKSNFPSSAKATTDTELSDSVNSCKNSTGILVKNPAALEADKDYYVHFYLKKDIPAEGAVVTPSLQISADTGLLETASPFAGSIALFNGSLLGGYRSKFEYFVVETDSYMSAKDGKPWWIYPDGSGGLCWNSKETSDPC